MPDVIVDYGLPYIWDQFLFFFFKGLDDEGDPKGNCTFLFFLHAFRLMGISDGNADVNALNVLLLAC